MSQWRAPDGRSWNTISLEERLELQTDKSGGPDACWLWIGTRDEYDYGVVGVRGKLCRVGRVLLATPEGLEALHRCDNPPCCNPTHMWNGTHADNMQDMLSKGRSDQKGERNGRARVTADDVRAIRQASADGESYLSIASRYLMTRENVSLIVRRLRWRHVE